MRTLILSACAVLLVAAEAGEKAEEKAQAKALWAAASKAGDVWTCLQLESWGRSRKPALRLGSVLGDSTIIGEPLLTWPDRISDIGDFSGRLMVATDERLAVLAPDGRPVQAAIAIPGGGHHVFGYDGGVVAVIQRAVGELRVTVQRTSDGARTMAGSIPLRLNQSLGGERVVADDGSAIAVEVGTVDPVSGAGSIAPVLLSVGAPARPLNIAGPPIAVGRGGAWWIAGAGPQMVLQVGAQRRPVSAVASGPGLAACIIAGHAQLILPDGRDAPLAGGPAIGADPACATVGTWLVLWSGSGAKTVSQGDLLGDGAGVEVAQAPTLAMWRWADLLADPAAKPAATMPGDLSAATMFEAALWNWQGQQLELIDLSGHEPRREPFAMADGKIAWVSSRQHVARVHLGNGRYALYGMDKRELWQGVCADIEVYRPDLALVHRVQAEHHSWATVVLSPDPALRKEVKLELPDQDQSVRVSFGWPDVVVARADRSWWRSLGLNGKVTETGREAGPNAVPAPRCPLWSWYCPPGRFFIDGVRVRAKADAPPEDPIARAELIDAWRAGGTTVLLQETGGVLVAGRKRGEWIDLPAVAPADRWALAGNTPMVAMGDEMRSVAALAPGPKLEARDGLGALMALPPGTWRIERNRRFVVPHGRQMDWDDERLGWRPLRLRSPEASGMFIVTPGVLIELDPAAARMVGK